MTNTTQISKKLHIVTKIHREPAVTVLLIHGLASSSNTWHQLSKDLFLEGYNVIAPDLYGHGKSSRLEKYSVEEWASSIIEAIPMKPDVIIGHSIGGLVAAEIQTQLKAPKLILLDPVFFLPTNKLLLTSIQISFKEIMRSASYYNRRSKNKILADKIIRRREFLNFIRWDTSSTQALKPSPKTIIACIKEQSAKILIIHAHRSYIAPRHRLKKAIEYNAKVVSIKGGHNLHIEKYPAIKEEVLSFLGKTRTETSVAV